MEKACVILGAGASCDVYNGGAPIHRKEFCPPLARELFDLEKHPAYWNIIEPYPGAATISSYLTPKARSNEFNLEQELAALAHHHDAQVREHFKHVPPYLRDLLYQASHAYVPYPSCYIQLAYELLAQTPHELLFLILNYDDLLEQALTRFDDKTYQFQEIGSYIVSTRRAKVVKLHGSINWFKLIGPRQSLSWRHHVSSTDVLQKPPDNEIYVWNKPLNATLTQDIAIESNWVYPVLTAPLAGKKSEDMVCPDKHVSVAKEFLAACHKFLIIGTSGLDEDLLLLLNSAVRHPQAQMCLHIVDINDEQAHRTLTRFAERVEGFRNVQPASGNMMHTTGFRNYVSGEGVRYFSNA